MPATATRRSRAKCSCGCGQAPADTTRLRKLECMACGYTVRITREWIARGLPTCPCGADLEPGCLLDRVCLPGDAGDLAHGELAGRDALHNILSERARKAAAHRRRCKSHGCGAFTARGDLYCRKHADLEMPF